MERILTGLDSLVAFRNSQGTEARGTIIHVTRHLVVFEVYNPYSIVQLSEVLQQLRIMRGERTIYSGRAVVSNLVTTGLMLIVSATLVDAWEDLAGLAPGPEISREVMGFVRDWEISHKLRPSYQLIVSSIRSFLGELSRWLGQVEAATGADGPSLTDDQRKEFLQSVGSPVSPKMEDLFSRFEEEARQLAPEEVAVHKAFARRELHPLMLCSPFLHRTFTKPLGYAGDYQVVNMMVEDEYQGPNAYARLVNAYHLQVGPAAAHRNRIQILTDHLEEEVTKAVPRSGRMRVLNVGCGPAIEVQRFIRRNPLCDKCDFYLLDFNAETLDYVRDRLGEAIRESGRNPVMHYIHKSIHELLKDAARNNGTAMGPFEMVYCAGLFDYLSDRICSRLMQLFYGWVVPGGSVLVTNVHPCNPVRQAMEHFVEWYLIYRNERDFAEAAAGLKGETRIFTDSSGVNVFLELRKALA